MSNHNGNANKMVSDTPRTDDAWKTMHTMYELAGEMKRIERELNEANERIKTLIEERDRANRLADWKWNLRGEFESLLGTDNIEEGIKAVKALMERIKRLEEAGDAMASILNNTRKDWYTSDQCEISAFDWREAKEAKP